MASNLLVVCEALNKVKITRISLWRLNCRNTPDIYNACTDMAMLNVKLMTHNSRNVPDPIPES